MNLEFLDPGHLWALVGVAALAVAYVVLQRRRGRYAVRFTNLELLDQVAPKRPGWRRHLTAVAFLVAVTLSVVAWARPAREEDVPVEEATVVLAIDTSLSMEADDVDPDRITAAKAAASRFVAGAPETINIGLVAFDGAARLVVAPTTDHAAVTRAIDRLTLNEGTAIGEAILTSLDALEEMGAGGVADGGRGGGADAEELDPDAAHIVVMSDGETTVGRDNGEAAEAAADAGIRVSTIAFGTDEGVIYLPDDAEPIAVPVNRPALRDIAEETGGSFFEAASEDELAAVYNTIGSSVGTETELREITTWFVGIALLVMALTAGLSLAWSNRML